MAKKLDIIQDIIVKKENLIGKWKADENYTLEFKKNGRFVMQFLLPTYSEVSLFSRIINDKKTGDYFIDDKGILTMNYFWKEETIRVFKDSKIEKHSATYKYKVSTFSEHYFKLENITFPDSAKYFNRIE